MIAYLIHKFMNCLVDSNTTLNQLKTILKVVVRKCLIFDKMELLNFMKSDRIIRLRRIQYCIQARDRCTTMHSSTRVSPLVKFQLEEVINPQVSTPLIERTLCLFFVRELKISMKWTLYECCSYVQIILNKLTYLQQYYFQVFYLEQKLTYF